MCLLALVVVVKSLAQVIGGYLCCNGHDKINQDLNHRVTHLLSVARMEKGSATSITQALTQYNKKPPRYSDYRGALPCSLHEPYG